MRALLTMLAAVAVVAGCGGSEEVTGAPAQDVVELGSLDPITQRFEADRGQPRLLLILSPT
ncbi:MAG: hypothetical protein WD067_04545 [Gaiellaceae bacterium]